MPHVILRFEFVYKPDAVASKRFCFA